MGGAVGVTIRLKDGTEHRMCRWTNTLPWGIANERMLRAQPDPEHLANYLNEWLLMRADYAVNRARGKFQFPMTDCYAPWPLLAPIEYGLVVLDFKTGNLWSRQRYTSLSKFHAITLMIDDAYHAYKKKPSADRLATIMEQDPEGQLANLKRFFDAGRLANPVRFVEVYDVDGKVMSRQSGRRDSRRKTVWVPEPIPALLQTEDFGQFILHLDRDVCIDITTSPIAYHDLNERPWTEYKQILAGHGFAFTEEEEQEWAEKFEQEAEDSVVEKEGW